ncbi:MAG TPA: serine protein kinase RIO [Candidatus Methanomethylophilaceae archaeon]|nr:serine protein kinase RIO [Candidatus Methanomethylophilaceae archaeon]
MSSYDEIYSYMEKHVDALKTDRTGDERQTEEQVFDKRTLMTLYEFMTSGIVDTVQYPISTGKEGNVFYAEDPDGGPLALKIFRTATATFKGMARYIDGDPRFKGTSRNRVKMIYAWTQKEFKNLYRYYDAGIPVPEPIAYSKNCLVEEFIGDENGPAPQLKDVELDDPNDTYDEIVSFIIDGWRDARLVHGDLSEYNVLMPEDGPVLIDCGQAMTVESYGARELLERDIKNVNRFFGNRGADLIAPEIIMEETLSTEKEEEEE